MERLPLKLRTLEEAALAAAAEAAKADAATADALAARDAYDEGQLQPTHKAAQQAEKEAHGLSRDVAQLKERLDSADYISAQEKAIQTAKEQMEAAQAARDAAVTAHDVRRKEVTAHWSEFFLARLQQINPDVETAFIDPSDFTTRVKERHTADKTFAESSVAGSPKVATNVALLLALRDLARVDPAVRVPPADDHRLPPGRPRSTGPGPCHRATSDRHPHRHRQRRLPRRLRLPGHRRHQRPSPPPLPGRTGNQYRHRQPVLRPRTPPRPEQVPHAGPGPYWVDIPQFAHCDASKVTVTCTVPKP